MKHRAGKWFWLIVMALGLASAQPACAAVLFESNEVIEATIEAPFKAIFRDRRDDAEYQDGIVVLNDSGAEQPGSEQRLPVRIRTRGKFRRDRKNCSIPPLRLNFAADDVAGTVFEGQNKLKLVLPCRKRSDYFEYVELEYLSYRIFNQLSDASFRVRPLQLRLVDTAGRGKVTEVRAFVIESKKAVAERGALEPVDVETVPSSQLAREQAGWVGLFQYLIGNTDWSMLSAAADACCHNTVPFKRDQTFVPVPYDFDFSGLVNASYADPNPRLKIRNVRQRLYRGPCVRSSLARHVEHFNARRTAIDELLDQARLSDKRARSTRAYVDEFWAVLNSPEQSDTAFSGRCR